MKNWHVWALILIFMVYLGAQAITFSNEISDDGDNAEYMILAQSIATGNGYKDLSNPDMPVHTKFPPMFPVMLVPLYLFFGFNIPAYNLFMIIISCITLFVIYLLFDTISDKKTAIAITAMTAFSFQFFHWSHRIMSEVPFILFTCLALYYMFKEQGWMMIIFTLLSVFTRSVGLVLIPAIFIHLMVKKNYKAAFVFILLTMGPFLLWSFKNAHNRDYASQAYFNLIKYNDPYDSNSGLISLENLGVRSAHHMFGYLSNLGQFMFHYAEKIQQGFFLFPIFFVIPIFIGLFMMFKDKLVFSLYTLMYLGMMVLWPWQTIRLIVPLLPIVYYMFIEGTKTLLDFVKSDEGSEFNKPLAMTIVLCLLVAVQVPSFIDKIKMDSVSEYSPEMVRYKEMAEWAATNITEGNVILSRKPALFYIWSGGLQTKTYPFTNNQEEWKNAILSADYLVYDELSDASITYVAPIIKQYEYLFYPEYYIDRTAIFRINIQQTSEVVIE